MDSIKLRAWEPQEVESAESDASEIALLVDL